LRIPRVVVPQRPGALSALGALASDVVMDASRTVMLDTAAAGGRLDELERAFQQMERTARAALKREGFGDERRQRHERSVSARYKGQSFELEINYKSAETLAAAFHRAHLARYGYALDGSAVEIVSLRLRSRGLVEKPSRERVAQHTRVSKSAPQATASVYFTTRPSRVAVFAREELAAGARLQTPCIVTEYSSTTLVPASARAARIDAHGNLIIEL
jgi:N-methylhydantoinase A